MDIEKYFDEAVTELDKELSFDLELNSEHEYQFELGDRILVFLKGDVALRAWKFLTIIPIDYDEIPREFFRFLLVSNALSCINHNAKFAWNPRMQEILFQRLSRVVGPDPHLLKKEVEIFINLAAEWHDTFTMLTQKEEPLA